MFFIYLTSNLTKAPHLKILKLNKTNTYPEYTKSYIIVIFIKIYSAFNIIKGKPFSRNTYGYNNRFKRIILF